MARLLGLLVYSGLIKSLSATGKGILPVQRIGEILDEADWRQHGSRMHRLRVMQDMGTHRKSIQALQLISEPDRAMSL